MAAGYNYTTLTQAIQDYTDNQETTFVANIDNFIRAAEERILKEAPLEVFRKNVSANCTTGNKFLAKPTDWLYTYSVSILPSSEHKFLLNKDVNFIQEFWPDPTAVDEPRYYSDFDVSTFILAPTPDDTYDVELHYFYRPESIVDAATGETWLGTNAGQALLYGSLVEGYTYIKGEPDMIQVYNQQYDNAVARIVAFAQGAEGNDFYRRSGS